MYNLSKKHVSSATNALKNTKKFFSVLTVLLMLITTLSSVVSSQSSSLNIIQNKIENQNTTDNPTAEIIKKSTIKERLSLLREKICSIIEKLIQTRNRSSDILIDEIDENDEQPSIDTKSIKSPILRSFGRLLRLRLLNITVMFYTNYAGIENQVELKFLKEKKIDVDNDSKADIKVKLGLSFSIERFLHFSINFKYLITRLPDFPNTTARFEAYAEIYFPGLLFIRQRGDRIRFGYESPDGEEVPNSCQIIYRYLPNIVYLRKKPEHRIEINPGKNIGNSKLILLLGYTNFNYNKTIVSELNTRVVYNPAVKASISIGGNGILGGSTFEFKRELSGDSQVDMYCSIEKNNMTVVGYVKDLPKKVTFAINFGRDGNIIFDTHNQAPSEIGVCDDFYNPQNKIYFTDLLTKAVLNWNIRALIQQKVELNFFTNSPGASIKGDLKFNNNTTANFNIFSKEKLDCQTTIDLKKGHVVFKRNKVDISVALSSNFGNTSIDFSTNISSFCDEAFEFSFGKLKDGDSEVIFTGSYLEISDFNLYVLKHTINDTREDDYLTLGSNTESSELLERYLRMNFSSLRFTSRDFIKINTENKTQNINISGGGNGSIKLTNFSLNGNLLKTPIEFEVLCGLFEIESDHFYGSAINLSLNLSNTKNTTIESFALENAINKFIIEGFSIKGDFFEMINLKKFIMNFSSSGILQLTYENNYVNLTGVISGPGLFEIEEADLNLLNSSVVAILEDISMSGPTTFFIYGFVEFQEGNITDGSLKLGGSTNWHIGKIYFKAFVPLIQIIKLDGVGEISFGGLVCPNFDKKIDVMLNMDGSWNWEKIYFIPLLEEAERPGLQVGSFSGNFTFKFHIDLRNLIKFGHLDIITYSTTRLDHFKLEGSNWSISGISLQMQPGDFTLFWNLLNSSNFQILLDSSDGFNLEFDTFLVENKNAGEIFTFKSRGASARHLEIITDINRDGDGFLFLDTDNQFCSYEITRANLIKINKTFRAENFNISWNLSGGLFNIINSKGFLEFGAEFQVLVFINSKWRVLISINQPAAEFTYSPSDPEINETIQFDGSESYYTEPITRYDWKWDITGEWHNDIGAYPTHSFSQNGSYKVTLRVWSGLKRNTCSKIVEVGESQGNMNFVYENEPLFEGYPLEILKDDTEDNDSSTTNELVIYRN